MIPITHQYKGINAIQDILIQVKWWIFWLSGQMGVAKKSPPHRFGPGTFFGDYMATMHPDVEIT